MANIHVVKAHEVLEFHKASDVDSSKSAQHHTLGSGVNQAAPGSTAFDSGWIPLVLTNGWIDFDVVLFGPSSIRRLNKVVEVRGVLTAGVIGSAACVVPPHCIPSTRRIMPAMTDPNVIGRLELYTSGALVPATGSNSYFSLHAMWTVD